MVGPQFRDVQAEVDTSGDNIVLTVSSPSETRTPIGAIFEATHVAAADSGSKNGAKFSVGAADGTSEFYAVIQAEDNVNPSNSDHSANTDACIALLSTAGAVEAKYAFSSFSAGAVTLTKTTAPPAAHLLTVRLFFEGSVQVGTITTGGAVGTIQEETCNFRPKTLFLVGSGGDAFGGTINNNVQMTLGIVAEQNYTTTFLGGGHAQGCISQHSNNGNVTTQTTHFRSRQFGIAQIDGAAFISTQTRIVQGGRFGFIEDGFTVQDNTDTVQVFGYLAHDPGPDVTVIAFHGNPGAATGTVAITGIGFEPQSILHLTNHNQSQDNFQTGGTSGSFGLGFTTATEQHTANYVCDDNNSPSANASFQNAAYATHTNGTGGAGWVATFTSFDSDGWTASFSAAVSQANRRWLHLLYSVADTSFQESDTMLLSESVGAALFQEKEDIMKLVEELGTFLESKNSASETILLKETRGVRLAGAYVETNSLIMTETVHGILDGDPAAITEALKIEELVFAVTDVEITGETRGEIQGPGIQEGEITGPGVLRGEMQ